jgi:hypothetical protein
LPFEHPRQRGLTPIHRRRKEEGTVTDRGFHQEFDKNEMTNHSVRVSI